MYCHLTATSMREPSPLFTGLKKRVIPAAPRQGRGRETGNPRSVVEGVSLHRLENLQDGATEGSDCARLFQGYRERN